MERSSNTSTYGALVLAALTAYWGYITLTKPIRSPRPKDEGNKPVALIGDQFVPARLWQDPLDAAQPDISPTDLRTRPEHLQSQLNSNVVIVSKTKAKVLLITVEGNAYPEDKEVRRRFRFAVQQALVAEGYSPDDRNNLGLLLLQWPEGHIVRDGYLSLVDCGNPGVSVQPNIPLVLRAVLPSPAISTIVPQKSIEPAALSVIRSNYQSELEVALPKRADALIRIPYEWFSGKSNANPVLVLWMPEEHLADLPMHRLGLLLDTVFLPVEQNIDSISLLGPRSSNTLKAMANADFGAYYTNQFGAFQRKFKVFSCQATVPDNILLESDSAFSGSRELMNETMGKHLGVSPITNGIRLDHELARMLIAELSNRNLVLGSRTNDPNRFKRLDTIAVFYESDTAYGRSLELLIRSAVTAANSGVSFQEAFQVERKLPPRTMGPMISIPYLRGIDGTKPSETSTEASNSGASALAATAKEERGEGDHQVDYAKRISARLQYLSRDRFEKRDAGEVAAIGILGSDAYDKLVLLQVLRERFKEAIFFTTDLDSRLVHPQEHNWAQNLIVASAFPLEPNENSPLVFRDAYQTALFQSCKSALSGVPLTLPPVQLVEIGRSAPVALKAPDGHIVSRNRFRSWFHSHETTLNWIAAAVILITLLMLTLLLRGLARTVYRFFGFKATEGGKLSRLVATLRQQYQRKPSVLRLAIERFRRRKAIYLVICGLAAAVLLVGLISAITVLATRPGEEPFALWEGVSVWPTEFLRVLTIFFCIISLVWAYRTYKLRMAEILDDYCMEMSPLGPRDVDLCAFPKRFANLRQWFSQFWKWAESWHHSWSITAWPSSNKTVNARELLVAYQERGFLRARAKRVLAFAGVYLVLALAIFQLGGFPHSPVRGPVSSLLDLALLILSVASLVLLIAYVVDITRLTERLLRRLGDGKTRWPSKLALKYASETGLDERLVSGYIDVHFVAHHTSHVNVASYLPFVAIGFMAVARSPFFDRWPWPPSLQLVFGLYFLIAFICAVAIRNRAEKVRMDALESLERARATSPSTSPAEKIELLLKRIQTTKIGAYASWWHDPALVGLLIPPGSAGALSIIKQIMAS
jgi:hypothetical protein